MEVNVMQNEFYCNYVMINILSFPIEATATNNQAEYQALLKRIRLLQERCIRI